MFGGGGTSFWGSMIISGALGFGVPGGTFGGVIIPPLFLSASDATYATLASARPIFGMGRKDAKTLRTVPARVRATCSVLS